MNRPLPPSFDRRLRVVAVGLGGRRASSTLAGVGATGLLRPAGIPH